LIFQLPGAIPIFHLIIEIRSSPSGQQYLTDMAILLLYAATEEVVYELDWENWSHLALEGSVLFNLGISMTEGGQPTQV
jgi:hypothetical protein